MEGESDFLMFLPSARRQELTDYWYRGVSGGAKETIARELEGFPGAAAIAYKTKEPEKELQASIEARLGRVLRRGFDLEQVKTHRFARRSPSSPP